MNKNNVGPIEPARSANRVRDHLANERTFLAWVRTSLALVAFGFVLARMGLFLRQFAMMGGASSRPEPRGSHEFLIVGVVFLLLGTAVCAGSGWLYHRTRRAIDLGRYEPPGRAITAMVAVVVVGGLVLAGLLLWRVAIPAGG